MKAVALVLLMLAAQSAPPKLGKITSTADPTQDFSTIRTYAWERGREAFDRDVHKSVTAAIEAELAAHGLQQADAKSANVTVAYFAMGSSELNFDELDKAKGKEIAPSKVVGTLGIAMYRQPGGTRIWTAQTREYVDVSADKRDATARTLAGRLVETLPRKKP